VRPPEQVDRVARIPTADSKATLGIGLRMSRATRPATIQAEGRRPILCLNEKLAQQNDSNSQGGALSRV
jgi:hypothetical protein